MLVEQVGLYETAGAAEEDELVAGVVGFGEEEVVD